MMKQARYKQQTMKAYDHRASTDAAGFDNYKGKAKVMQDIRGRKNS